MISFGLIALGGVAVLVAGLGLGYWFGNSGRDESRAKANEVQQELDEYRQSVSGHFAETANHFQSLGDQYRKLYEHLATGADRLCHPPENAFKESLKLDAESELVEPAINDREMIVEIDQETDEVVLHATPDEPVLTDVMEDIAEEPVLTDVIADVAGDVEAPISDEETDATTEDRRAQPRDHVYH